MAIHWKAVEHYFTVVLFTFVQFHPDRNFGNLSTLDFGTDMSERVIRIQIHPTLSLELWVYSNHKILSFSSCLWANHLFVSVESKKRKNIEIYAQSQTSYLATSCVDGRHTCIKWSSLWVII